MPTVTKVLKLIFAAEDGKERTISIKDPRLNLTSDEVDAAMEAVITANVFTNKMGHDLTRIVDAKFVEQSTTDYEVEYPNPE